MAVLDQRRDDLIMIRLSHPQLIQLIPHFTMASLLVSAVVAQLLKGLFFCEILLVHFICLGHKPWHFVFRPLAQPRGSFFKAFYAAIFFLQKIVILVGLFEKILKGFNAAFFGHVEVVDDAGENNVLFYTT